MQLDLFIASQPLFGGDAGTAAAACTGTEPAKARRGVTCHCSCSFHLSASQQTDNDEALRLGPLAADAVFIRLRRPGSAETVEFPAELQVTAGSSAASSRVTLSVGGAVFPIAYHGITKVLCSNAVHAHLQQAYHQLPQLVLADAPAAAAAPLAFATLVTPCVSFNLHLRTPTTDDVQSLASVVQVILAPHLSEQPQRQQQVQLATAATAAPGPSTSMSAEQTALSEPPGRDHHHHQQQQQRLVPAQCMPVTQPGADQQPSIVAPPPTAAAGAGTGPTLTAPARLTGAKRPAPTAEGSPVQPADQPAVAADTSGQHGAPGPTRPPPDASAGAAAAVRGGGCAGAHLQLSSAWVGQLGLEVQLLEQVCQQAAAAVGGGGGGVVAGTGSEALLHHNLDALAHLHLAASSLPVWHSHV